MATLAERYGILRASIGVTGLGDNTIVAAVGNRRIIVLNFVVVNSVATAQTIAFKSGASTSLSGVMGLPSSVGGTLAMADPDVGLFETLRGQALVLNLGAATAVAGFVNYFVPLT